MLLLKAILMGLVEGVSEFLPISSTGHLIIAGELLGFLDQELRSVFMVAIQLGAILAVCWLYRQKLAHVTVGVVRGDAASWRFAINLLIAFLPAALLGLLFYSLIKGVLFFPVPVAGALILGGFVIIWAERRTHVVRIHEVDDMRWRDALLVGCAQCFALIPGTSRSGATIIGGLLIGLSRKAATEFSFFLAIPTMFAATIYDVYKHRALFHADDVLLLVAGFVAAFLAALLTVKALVGFVAKHSFLPFAWYRIGFGLLVLGLWWLGVIVWQGE